MLWAAPWTAESAGMGYDSDMMGCWPNVGQMSVDFEKGAWPMRNPGVKGGI